MSVMSIGVTPFTLSRASAGVAPSSGMNVAGNAGRAVMAPRAAAGYGVRGQGQGRLAVVTTNPPPRGWTTVGSAGAKPPTHTTPSTASRMVLPAPNQWRQSCIGSPGFVGSTTRTRTGSPCILPVSATRDLATFAAMNVDEAMSHVQVGFKSPGDRPSSTGGYTGNPNYLRYYGSGQAVEDLLKWSWALLYYNRDLYEWAACFVAPGDDSISKIPDTFEGRGARLKLTLDGDCPHDKVFRASGLACPPGAISGHALPRSGGGGEVNICADFGIAISGCLTQNTIWWHAINTWTRPDPSPSRRLADRLCASAGIASAIAHELVHVLNIGEDNDTIGQVPQPCASSYMIESAFLWALANRYPDLALSPCCSAFYLTPGVATPSLIGSSAIQGQLGNFPVSAPPGGPVVWCHD